MNSGSDLQEEFHINEAELFERLPVDLLDLQEQEKILLRMLKDNTAWRDRMKRKHNRIFGPDQDIEAALRAVQAKIRTVKSLNQKGEQDNASTN